MNERCPNCGRDLVERKEIRETFPVVVAKFACGTTSYDWQDGMTRTDYGKDCNPQPPAGQE